MKKWGVYILAGIGFAVYGAMTGADRDNTGAIVDGGNVDAFQVRVGDCFNDTSSSNDEIHSVPGVPCSEPHDNEAYAVVDLTIDSYPEGDGMAQLAYDSCMERFDTFVGKDYESSSLEIFTMYPSTESWKQDDREVVCALYDMNANKLVGSVKGRGL